MSALGDGVFVLLQRLLPQHALTRLCGRLARAETPWLKNALIRAFAAAYGVDLREAAEPDPTAYPTFNAFFTRALAPDAREWPAARDAVGSPVDGTVSAAGLADGDTLLQAKGHSYSLSALLAGDAELAAQFRDGPYATVYLAPRDYHRIHMPFDGALERMLYVPGRLYSVDARTERGIEGLFARNERVICAFATPAGPMAVVLVGALVVGGMETAWRGSVRSARGSIGQWRYDPPIRLARGAEMGRFSVGSTVIVLFARDRVRWAPTVRSGAVVRLGEPIGTVTTG